MIYVIAWIVLGVVALVWAAQDKEITLSDFITIGDLFTYCIAGAIGFLVVIIHNRKKFLNRVIWKRKKR